MNFYKKNPIWTDSKSKGEIKLDETADLSRKNYQATEKRITKRDIHCTNEIATGFSLFQVTPLLRFLIDNISAKSCT